MKLTNILLDSFDRLNALIDQRARLQSEYEDAADDDNGTAMRRLSGQIEALDDQIDYLHHTNKTGPYAPEETDDEIAESADYEASERYVKLQEQAQKLLQQVGSSLQQHAVKQQGTPRNWGWPGDLTHVVQKLDELVSFLSSNDSK